MTCVPTNPTFRLLDHLVGWDPEPTWGLGAWRGLIGLDEAAGLRLSGEEAGVVLRGSLAPWLAPARIAPGCGPCDTWLATDNGLRLRAACSPCFETVWTGVGPSAPPVALLAVAAGGNWVAVLDAASTVWILLSSTRQVVARFAAPGAKLLAFDRRSQVLVGFADGRIAAYGLDGDLREPTYRNPAPGGLITIATDDDDRVWTLSELNGRPHLFVSDPDGVWRAGEVGQLATEVRRTGLSSAGDAGFCLADPTDPGRTPSCWDWAGCPRAAAPSGGPGPGAPRIGQLITGALDSGIRRCEWHRVRADCTVPAGTRLEIAVATAEVPHPSTPLTTAESLPAEPPWLGFAQGPPHPRDWQVIEAEAGTTPVDVLIRQPPGRYLYVRVRMWGEAEASPVLRQLRLDMPRVTSAQHLPAVYAEDPRSSDFTQRFTATYDAHLDGLSAAISELPALLDVRTTPPEVLPWLARFFDIGLDDTWTTDQRRAVLLAAPDLYRLRGTPEGLRQTLVLALPSAHWPAQGPVIREFGLDRAWGAVGRTTELGAVRLFGRARARFRLGGSPLGATPIQSFGNPDQDAMAAVAYRFEVVLPALADWDPGILALRAQSLVDAVKPAHTLGAVRVGGSGFTVGVHSAVGIDTLTTAPPPAVVGAGIRLGRTGVLGRGTAGPSWRVGLSAAGHHTVVE